MLDIVWIRGMIWVIVNRMLSLYRSWSVVMGKESGQECPYSKACGGCSYQNVSYEEQLSKKQAWVEKLLKGYGKVEPIVGMAYPYHYRNKVHAVFGQKKGGEIICGTYEAGSHRVVDIPECLIEALFISWRIWKGDLKADRFSCERDDLKISGTVFLPEKYSGKLPAVIISHEFMANQLFSYPYAKALANEGYAVFCYDFCGGGIVSSSEGKSTDMSVLTEKEDLQAVITYVKSQDYVDEMQITLMGCSQGGFVSAIVAAEQPEEIKSLILLYPALSIPDGARSGHMLWAKFDPENIPETFYCSVMKLGRRYAADVQDMDAYKEIKGYTGNVLIVHGDADNLVNISGSEKALSVYEENGTSAKLVTVSGAGHIFFNGKHREQAISDILRFLKAE